MAKAGDLESMFQNATVFNQDITSWNTGFVKTMQYMFAAAPAFNQNIGSWNTANVTRTDFMFNNATAFNQNLGAWNVSKIDPTTSTSGKGAISMFAGASAMSTANLDSTLCGWAPQTVSASVNLGLGTLRPSCATGEACKTTLAGKGWVIVSGVCI